MMPRILNFVMGFSFLIVVTNKAKQRRAEPNTQVAFPWVSLVAGSDTGSQCANTMGRKIFRKRIA
jgi:hypothetical protein